MLSSVQSQSVGQIIVMPCECIHVCEYTRVSWLSFLGIPLFPLCLNKSPRREGCLCGWFLVLFSVVDCH